MPRLSRERSDRSTAWLLRAVILLFLERLPLLELQRAPLQLIMTTNVRTIDDNGGAFDGLLEPSVNAVASRCTRSSLMVGITHCLVHVCCNVVMDTEGPSSQLNGHGDPHCYFE